jgi:hypothetical protein
MGFFLFYELWLKEFERDPKGDFGMNCYGFVHSKLQTNKQKHDSRTQAHSYNQFYMWLQQLVSEHSLFDSGLSNYMIHTLKKNFKKLTFLVAQKSRMLQSTPLTGISSLRFKGSLHLEDGSRGLTKVDGFY